jgi:protein HIRA/HIR1
LLVYAKKVAEEGFRGKAEELIKELFGLVYW